jgi:hypothetical protein
MKKSLISITAPLSEAMIAKGRVRGFSSSPGLSIVGILPEQVDVNVLQG